MDVQLDKKTSKKDYSKKFWKLAEIKKNLEAWIERPEEKSPLLQAMLDFQESPGIETLHELTPGLTYNETPESLSYFMMSLLPFYHSGFLFERGQQPGDWWATGFFFKGQWFDLDLKDQVRLAHKLPTMSPLQVKKAAPDKILKQYGLEFMPIPHNAHSFLFRPTHVTGLLLSTESPELFTRLKVDASLKLINRYFNS